MPAGKYDLDIEQGATFLRILTISENSVLKDLTGYVARAQIRRTVKSSTITATITATITDPANGEITLKLTAEETTALVSERSVWDLEIDDQAGVPVVTRLLAGNVTIDPNVTR